MKRLGLTLLVLMMLSGVAYYVFTHENIERAERLEQEVEKLRQQNRELAAENAQMSRQVVALRDDPRLAERRARADSRLARPGEVIFKFGEPEEPLQVHVLLAVGADTMQLAGDTLGMEQLLAGLNQLQRDVPHARLQVRFDAGADVLRRQRVRDLVAESALGQAEYLNEDEE